MSFALSGAAVLAVLAAAAFVFLLRGLLSRREAPKADLEWCRQFSAARYRPMERLFAAEDYEFLAAQPGFHPKIYRKLQESRREVFRHYLRCLSRDFDRLSAAVKLLLLQSPQDRPDLASSLLKQRMIFTCAIAMVRCRLALQTVGIGTVDVRGVVAALEAMRNQLGQLSQRPARVPIAS